MSAATDRFAGARAVADAVLYEGYLLYPYRASARKNQMRWQFGVLVPPAMADAYERSSVRTECVVDPGATPALHVRLRCLQLQHRTVEAARRDGFEPVDVLDVDGIPWCAWDEAVEHDVEIAVVNLLPCSRARREVAALLPAGCDVEELRSETGELVGRAIRTREAVAGVVRIETTWADGSGIYLAVSVTVENSTDWMRPAKALERPPCRTGSAPLNDAVGPDWTRPAASRDEVMRRSLVAVHTLLAIDDGTFVSSLDPPPPAAAAVAGCHNDGTFPVLVGGGGDVMLSSPIILYDQPEIAPESAGDLYDATEIDEILALRVLTLTDDEKSEARGTDAWAAAIVDRCDDMPPEMWARLHGAIRSITPVAEESQEITPWWDPDADSAVDPWSECTEVAGVELGAGSKVVLRPGHRRADAHDMFLAGMNATVTGVFRDAEGEVHLAVTVDDDPANEELAWQGRYLFFRPDEVEPLLRSPATQAAAGRSSAGASSLAEDEGRAPVREQVQR